MSTQAPPQKVPPEGHAQAPAVHVVRGAMHAIPQEPQLDGSIRVSMQVPPPEAPAPQT